MLNSTDTVPVTHEQDTVSTNPNRVTMYLTPLERVKMQKLAEHLADNGVEGLLDKNGVVQIKALVKYLVDTALAKAT